MICSRNDRFIGFAPFRLNHSTSFATLLDRSNKLANRTIHARRIDVQLLNFQDNAMQRSTAIGWLELAHTSKRLLEEPR